MAAGKGTEDISDYIHSDLIFCDIENIHVMRNSINYLSDAILPGGIGLAYTTSLSNHLLDNHNFPILLAPGIAMTTMSLPISTSSKDDSSSSSTTSSTGGNIYSCGDILGYNIGFFNKLEESGWLRHIQFILRASKIIAEKIHLEGSSVLLHCSDGW